MTISSHLYSQNLRFANQDEAGPEDRILGQRQWSKARTHSKLPLSQLVEEPELRRAKSICLVLRIRRDERLIEVRDEFRGRRIRHIPKSGNNRCGACINEGSRQSS